MKVSFEERRDRWMAWFRVIYKREPNLPASAMDGMSKDAFLAGYDAGFKASREPLRRPPGIKSLLEIVPFPSRPDT